MSPTLAILDSSYNGVVQDWPSPWHATLYNIVIKCRIKKVDELVEIKQGKCYLNTLHLVVDLLGGLKHVAVYVHVLVHAKLTMLLKLPPLRCEQ